MTRRFLILTALTCGPFLLTLAAWIKVYWSRRRQPPHAFGLLALSMASANALLSAGTFLYYQLRPSSDFVPPWKDPEILQLAMLGFLAPVAMLLGFGAVITGAPKWLVCIVEIASVLLLVIAVMAGSAV